MQHYVLFYYIIYSFYIILYYTILYYTVLFCTVLYYGMDSCHVAEQGRVLYGMICFELVITQRHMIMI